MIPMKRIPTLPQEQIVEIFLWLPVMSLMCFRCVSKYFDALVLDSDFTHVHHLHSMTRDGGTKFLMGKAEDLYVWKDVADILKPKYGPPQGFCESRNGEIIFIADLDFSHVHHLLSMTRDGGTKFIIGKAKDLYVVDLNEEGNISI
ncbi:hypothetical protein H5410_064773 [Solanum commersonii]|uniref:F-box domain-containing protein n=1 Tax=Solanum commersonii TaxID=4109 RepID=A0A9J5VZ40_SOLCO|nr:hypothetical protein H5410_064773 [Solanum commersonii]